MTLNIQYRDRSNQNHHVDEDFPLPVNVATGSTADAFGNLRTSSALSLQALQTQYGKQDLLYSEKIVGGATSTHLPNESSVRMNVTAVAGDRIVRQVKRYLRYQPGKSQLIKPTFTFGAANGTKMAGYFDDENGVFFEQTSAGLFLVLRSFVSGSVVDTRVAQSDWNRDKLDGTGNSTVTLDGTARQILFIDLQWLGNGDVRCGFNIGGNNIVAHTFLHSNDGSGAYITTANLPVRYELLTDGSNASSMIATCFSVDSEGGEANEPGIPFVVGSGNSTQLDTAGEVPILLVRPKTTFNGITNRISPDIEAITSIAFSEPYCLRVYYNATITTPPTFTDANTTDSSVEYANAAALAVGPTTFSDGIQFAEIYVPAATAAGNNAISATSDASLLQNLPLTLDIDGANPDTILVTAENIGSASGDVRANLKWSEVY